ncbi:hypothetical protein Dimus_024572 [Dionaea muscipula]
MGTQIQFSLLNLKRILICSFFLLFVFLLLWRSKDQLISPPQISPFVDHHEVQCACPSYPQFSPCTTTPPSLAQALIHYATSNITPQQTLNEISVSERVLRRKSPCNFLVFGLGYDSLMWAALNYGGRTVFVEEDRSWIGQIRRRFPELESYHAVYDTKVSQAEQLLKDAGEAEDCKVVVDPRQAFRNFSFSAILSGICPS